MPSKCHIFISVIIKTGKFIVKLNEKRGLKFLTFSYVCSCCPVSSAYSGGRIAVSACRGLCRHVSAFLPSTRTFFLCCHFRKPITTINTRMKRDKVIVAMTKGCEFLSPETKKLYVRYWILSNGNIISSNR